MDFGFTIQTDNQIDFDRNNFDLFHEVKKMEPSILICKACGTCTATCSAARFTDFSLRKIIHRILRGDTKDIDKEAEKCMLCGKCHIACPRGVNTRNIIIALRMAIQSQKPE